MSKTAYKPSFNREILHKEVGFPMAGRKKVLKGEIERFCLHITEDLTIRLNSFLDNNPYTDKTKTIRQAIAEFLDRQPLEPKQRKAS